MADPRPTLTSALVYRDPRAAIAWLTTAFDFELVMLIEDADGHVAHAEMHHGNSAVMIGSEWSDAHRSPASLDGVNTQSLHLHIDTDVDAHCDKARHAGATIQEEPQDQFYGHRTYRCRDPEGHLWTVAQVVKSVSREEAEIASGLKITGWT